MMDSKKLLELLQGIVGKEFVTTDRVAAFAYSRDTSVFGGSDVETVVRPGSTEEVSEVMSLASEHRRMMQTKGDNQTNCG